MEKIFNRGVLIKKSSYLQNNWFNLLLIFLVQILVVFFYLHQLSLTTSLGVPLDDSYIHYQYAKNLALHRELAFNHGEPSIGTTSVLWVLLLAAFYKFGNIVAISIFLGVLFSLVTAFCIFEIANGMLKNSVYALFVALLYILCGNNIWFSLSGMEITMFLAFGLLSILMYSKNKLLLSGVFSGLLSLTRPEGILLVVVIFFYEFINQYKHKRSFKRLLIILLVPLLFILPYLLYNFNVTGHFLPSTFSGRRWVAGLPNHISVSIRTYFYPLMWPYRIVMWVFMFHNLEQYVHLVPAAILIIGPLFLVCLGFLNYLSIIKASFKTKFHTKTALIILFSWFALHNIMYWIILPVLRHAGRYQAINLIMVWFFIALGIISIVHLLKSYYHVAKIKPIIAVLFTYTFIICMLSMWFWSGFYVSSTKHINNVHVNAGEWMNSNIPENAIIAAFDIGAVKYYSDRYILDLGGLIDDNFTNYLWNNRVVDYMKLKNVTHLAMVELYEKEEESLVYRLGIYEYNYITFELEELATFLYSDKTRWYEHRTPVGNAYPKIVIFKINWY